LNDKGDNSNECTEIIDCYNPTAKKILREIIDPFRTHMGHRPGEAEMRRKNIDVTTTSTFINLSFFAVLDLLEDFLRRQMLVWRP
jgi:hypothetical protein